MEKTPNPEDTRSVEEIVDALIENSPPLPKRIENPNPHQQAIQSGNAIKDSFGDASGMIPDC